MTNDAISPLALWRETGGGYGCGGRASLCSLLLHAGVVTLMFSLGGSGAVRQTMVPHVWLVAPAISAYLPARPVHQPTGGGGGGDRSPLAASQGVLPKASPKQFAPPAAVTRSPDPKLILPPTLVLPPVVNPPAARVLPFGDPIGRLGPPSGGPGHGGGIGSGSGGGVGLGLGPGAGPGQGGGFGRGVFKVGGGVSSPVLIQQVEPEYTEEARQAKLQGVLTMYIEVDERGLPRNLRVIRPLGHGLDEKALEAVKRWRFRPGLKDGKPVVVAAEVEVEFRLL